MAVTLSTIREALASTLRDGIDRQVNVYAYKPPDPQFPCLALVAGDGDYVTYNDTFDGLATVSLIIEVHISSLKLDEQIALDDFLSAGGTNGSSIAAAVHADQTLGGVVQACIVRAARGPTLNERDPDPLMGAVPVEIYCATGA